MQVSRLTWPEITSIGMESVHARSAGDARISFRRHGCRLLVVVADELQARFFTDAVVQMHGAAASNEKNVAHAPIGEPLHDVVGELDHRDTSATSASARPPRWARFHSIVRSIASPSGTEQRSPSSRCARTVLGT